MKHRLFPTVILLFFLIFSITQVNAQEEKGESGLFMIHEDVIYPYMADKYEEAINGFVNLLSENEVESWSFSCAQIDYYTYSYVIPVNDYEGLAKHFGFTETMMEKVGKENFAKTMSKFDDCYASHKNYLIRLDQSLSYKGKYGLDPKEEINFRHYDYLFVLPGKEVEIMEVLKEWKELYESKNIEQGYRV
ncbi:hypothetical protein ACFLS9_03975 [Bacteroidota bacterium]